MLRWSELEVTDHPRACGVYVPARNTGNFLPGSSPRVRGLRYGAHRKHHGMGIIPARAGFTASLIGRILVR